MDAMRKGISGERDETRWRADVSGRTAVVLSLAAAVIAATFGGRVAEARTRTFCGVVERDCGRHLQPACSSGPACDPGYHSYSGDPFPITINCPFPIPDVTIKTGCYLTIPSCDDCGGEGQYPCPEQTEQYCTPGCDPGYRTRLDLKCHRLRTVGEGCSVVNPCADGLNCDVCLLESCRAPLQCFPDPKTGAFSAEQCKLMYSADLAREARDLGLATTYGGGSSATGGVSASVEIGTVYGPNDEYGCFQTTCIGAATDVQIGDFAAVGFYQTYGDVAGKSFAFVEEAEIVDVLNFSTSQIKGGGVDGPLIGTEDAFTVGVSALPFPLSGGVYGCTTTLDTQLGTPPPTHTPFPTATPTATPIPIACAGDCDGTGSVTVSDLVRGVNIALGQQPIGACSSLDRNRDGQIEIDELIFAVTRALDGCPA
jgi:hypothetical protein